MIKAEVVKACKINRAPKKPGDIVQLDEATFNRLARQGVLKAEGAKAVKIVEVGVRKAEVGETAPKPNRKKDA